MKFKSIHTSSRSETKVKLGVNKVQIKCTYLTERGREREQQIINKMEINTYPLVKWNKQIKLGVNKVQIKCTSLFKKDD